LTNDDFSNLFGSDQESSSSVLHKLIESASLRLGFTEFSGELSAVLVTDRSQFNFYSHNQIIRELLIDLDMTPVASEEFTGCLSHYQDQHSFTFQKQLQHTFDKHRKDLIEDYAQQVFNSSLSEYMTYFLSQLWVDKLIKSNSVIGIINLSGLRTDVMPGVNDTTRFRTLTFTGEAAPRKKLDDIKQVSRESNIEDAIFKAQEKNILIIDLMPLYITPIEFVDTWSEVPNLFAQEFSGGYIKLFPYEEGLKITLDRSSAEVISGISQTKFSELLEEVVMQIEKDFAKHFRLKEHFEEHQDLFTTDSDRLANEGIEI
jgi:hypothetical protein